jgi:hypothetical protein
MIPNELSGSSMSRVEQLATRLAKHFFFEAAETDLGFRVAQLTLDGVYLRVDGCYVTLEFCS